MNTKKQWNKPVLANLSHSDTRGGKGIVGVDWTEDGGIGHMSGTTGHATGFCIIMSGTYTLTASSDDTEPSGAGPLGCPYGDIADGSGPS